MKDLRIVERFKLTGTEPGEPLTTRPKKVGVWNPIQFVELKKGDIFRMWGSDGTPDNLVGGVHDVCVALTDATPGVDDPQLSAVESIYVNGFAL